MKYHFNCVQPNIKGLQLQIYTHVWELSDLEITKMKEKWVDCQQVVVKHTKKSKLPPLVISEAHCSRSFLHKLAVFSFISETIKEKERKARPM
jgi:hypothetical protein